MLVFLSITFQTNFFKLSVKKSVLNRSTESNLTEQNRSVWFDSIIIKKCNNKPNQTKKKSLV